MERQQAGRMTAGENEGASVLRQVEKGVLRGDMGHLHLEEVCLARLRCNVNSGALLACRSI